MKIKDLENISLAIDINEVEVDHVAAIENYFFNTKTEDSFSRLSYTDRAINSMVKEKINFYSTPNNADSLLKCIKLSCVNCDSAGVLSTAEFSFDGGNSDSCSLKAECKTCFTKYYLSLPWNGLSIEFAKDKK